MKQKIIHGLSLVCLIGIILGLQYTAVAAEDYCYVPDGDEGFNVSNIFGKDNKWFYAGKYQRWVWAGTSTWIVVNDFDKEILILDGYASKATLGNNRNNYTRDYHLTRLTHFANVLRGFCDLGYELVGVMISHNHLDHTMDLKTLDVLLKADAGVRIEDNDAGYDKSEIPTEGSPAIFSEDYKVIASKDTVDDPESAEGYDNSDVFTHYLKFKDENGAYLDIQDMSSEDMEFSKKADLYSVADDQLVELDYDDPDVSIILGHFAIQTITWPHSNVPIKGDGRVTNLNIWHSQAPNARRVFISTSAGKREDDVEGKIFTDHLIYAWPHTAWDTSRDKITRIARDHIEFIYRGDELAFIFANHYDSNGPINSETEETEDLEARFYSDVVYQWGWGDNSLEENFTAHGALVSCGEDFTYCWHNTHRQIEIAGYKSEVLGMSAMNQGEDWYDTRVEVIYDNDCDGYADNEDNCPDTGNPGQADADNDDIGDACDTCTDTDGDGHGNPGFPANTCSVDNCPDTGNPGQADADNDAIGDVCDTCTDTDGDGYGNPGFPANTCSVDNCPDTGNPGQADADNDAIGDACDTCTDTDGDGYGNPGFPANTCSEDECPEEDSSGFDADGDGCIDSAEDVPELIADLGITNPGLENGLLHKALRVQDKIEDGKIQDACEQLDGMIEQAVSQSHHVDPPEDADILIQFLQNIQNYLGCNNL